jgi:hypothetical protein
VEVVVVELVLEFLDFPIDENGFKLLAFTGNVSDVPF